MNPRGVSAAQSCGHTGNAAGRHSTSAFRRESKSAELGREMGGSTRGSSRTRDVNGGGTGRGGLRGRSEQPAAATRRTVDGRHLTA